MLGKLSRAISLDDIEALEECIMEEVDINEKDENGDTPLIKAARSQAIKALECLIRNNVRLEEVDSKGQTALHCAVECTKNSTLCVEMLLDAHADKEAWNSIYGDTPLALACRLGKEEAARLLIERGANVEGAFGQPNNAAVGDDADRFPLIVAELKREDTPLMLAAKEGSFKVVKSLLNRGANVHALDYCQNTALHYAAMKGRDSCMELLLLKGADKNAENDAGDTPFFLAAVHGRVHALRCLINHKVDVNSTDSFDLTALMLAIENANTESVRYLVAVGADTQKLDGCGRNAFQQAVDLLKTEKAKTFPRDIQEYKDIIDIIIRNTWFAGHQVVLSALKRSFTFPF